MVKSGWKYVKRTLWAVVVLWGAYFLAALILSLISTHPEEVSCAETRDIYIATNGIHLEIILPMEGLEEAFRMLLHTDKEADYVSFGWGDRQFYLETPTWRDLKLSTALRALFLQSETAIHLTNYHRKYDHWVRLQLCPEQLDSLIGYLSDSFERDDQGRLRKIPNAGYTPYDLFYEGTGSYNCIRTCNQWVNQGLKAAKVKTSVWSPFDYGVMHHIRN